MDSNKYRELILSAKLADYGPVHGNIVIMPYGMDIWDLIKNQLSAALKETNHEQVYFPMFMPERFLKEEAEYIPGLSPRYFSVTKAGGKELSEPLAIRPTSEALACYMFSKWVNSYRDLPLKVFQWCNIARWEHATQPFIKETEIQWLEGHTVHESHQDALAEMDAICRIFKTFMERILCIPVSVGVEPSGRKFIGSLSTVTLEAMTPTGRALQVGAVYDLGRNFTTHFDVSFRTTANTKEICWMTDWGLGFRLIGAVALIHGDERGLRLPPAIAPIHVVLLQLKSKSNHDQDISNYGEQLRQDLEANGIRVRVDTADSRTMSQSLRDWEMKGVPVIIPVGDLEAQTGNLQLRRRDRAPKCNIVNCTAESLPEAINRLLSEIGDALYQNALYHKQQHILTSDSRDEMFGMLEHNWVAAGWCGSETCEKKLEEENGRILRYTEHDDDFVRVHHKCILCGLKSSVKAVFAKNH